MTSSCSSAGKFAWPERLLRERPRIPLPNVVRMSFLSTSDPFFSLQLRWQRLAHHTLFESRETLNPLRQTRPRDTVP